VREKRKLALLVGLVLFHLILISIQVPKGEEPTYFEQAVFAVFSPLQRAVVSAAQKVSSLWSDYFYLRDVRRQNQKMRDEVFRLRQENLVLQNMLLNYKGEREIRSLLSTISRSILVVSVVGFDSSQIYKSIILNRGSADGIKKDMVVLDRRGQLVGRVIDPVTSRQAKVQLITDEASGVGVITERNRVLGVLSGDAAGRCLMKYVLRTDKSIEPEEEVTTSGFDGIYPAGIPVGVITEILEDRSLFKKIHVRPHLDFSDLGQVAVLTVDLRDLS
jgi:rod shape-determining protein MreC